MFDIFVFFLGLFLLVIGGTGVIDNSLALAGKLKISPLIVGIIFVGIGTSLPEIFISIFSGLDGATELGLGSIIGSNIAHICLFLGAVLLFIKEISVGEVKTQQNALLMLSLTFIFSLFLIIKKFLFLPGLIFIILGFVVIYWHIKEGKRGAISEDRKDMEKLNNINNEKKLSTIGFLFVISLIFLILGGKLVVDSGTKIAQLLGVSSFIIGATVVAVGTSLPELTVTIGGALKEKDDKLVVGNILGSNIYNILFCGGILGLFNTGGINNPLTIAVFVISNLFFITLVFLYRGRKIPRYFSIILLALYILYLRFLFTY